ncbi:MAG: hypothetical protein EXR98_05630 [Gemmataceae bacterium]|nr:hypothetical protein [Gemmataceae bacterium]
MRALIVTLAVVGGLHVHLQTCDAQTATDLPAGKKLITLEGQLWNARWSQDGKTILTCTHRKTKDDKDDTSRRFKRVDLWDAATGKPGNSLGELEIPSYPFHYLSAAGVRLVISQGFFLRTGEMEVWDTKRANLDHRISVEIRQRPMYCISVSANGDLIAEVYGGPTFKTAGTAGTGGINIYEAATGKKVRTLREEGRVPQRAIFTLDGKSVITRLAGDVVHLWDIKTGKVLHKAQAPVVIGSSEMMVSPDGKKLVIGAMKKEALQVWSIPELKTLGTIPNPFETVMRVEFSPSGKRLLATGYRQGILIGGERKLGAMVWDVEKNKMLHDWNTTTFQCGFCGEGHLGVGEPHAIMCYPIGPVGKKAMP